MQVDKKINPLAVRRMAQTKTVTAVHRITFRRCAELYLQARRGSWTSTKHADQWATTLNQHAYPVIGEKPVEEVCVDDLKQILEPIWSTVNETASRLRGRIERVLSWATVMKHRSGENPARWSGCLSEVLPPRSSVREMDRHHNALAYNEAPAFMEALRAKRTMAARLLEFLMLTAVRTTEARAATWSELDLGKSLWTIPKERMKTKIEHKVPLSGPAVELLVRLQNLRKGCTEPLNTDYVFPNAESNDCLSNMAMLTMIKKGMNRSDITPHGMRATFRTWVAERTDFPGELAEAALAHKLKNKVEAAYQRGDYLQKRKTLMQTWAEYLGSYQQRI